MSRRNAWDGVEVAGFEPIGARGLARATGTILLAVKPSSLPEVVAQLGDPGGATTIVSFLAGVTDSTLRLAFPRARVVRTMTSLAFGRGVAISALSRPGETVVDIQPRVGSLLRLGGEVVDLPPEAMDLFTAAYACGLGWVDLLLARGVLMDDILEAMGMAIARKGGETLDSHRLAQALRRGHRAMAAEQPVGTLFRRVATPGGMTFSGGEVLRSALAEGRPLVEAMLGALDAAVQRARAIDPAVRQAVEEMARR